MASSLKSLIHDEGRYQRSYQLYLERSTEHQCAKDFIHSTLSGILASVVDGKSHLNVIGVGSGSGEIDLEILSELRLKHPGVTVDYEVVEPNNKQLQNFKALVSQTPGLDHIKFTWNQMTASEFEEQWKVKKMTKKFDFIHMIQMLYYVKDPRAVISFFQSLLDNNGKLLIMQACCKSMDSQDDAWIKFWKTYENTLPLTDMSMTVTCEDIKSFLDSKGVSYQSYELPNQVDITECFTEGNERGELLLDFVTHVLEFSKTASPELKAGVLEHLRHCSVESNSKVMLKNKSGAIVVHQFG